MTIPASLVNMQGGQYVADGSSRAGEAVASSERSFKSHLSREVDASRTSSDAQVIQGNSHLQKVNPSALQGVGSAAQGLPSAAHLNQLQQKFAPKQEVDGTDIAARAMEIAKEFEAFFLKEMWKNIDGFRLSVGDSSDITSNIWSEQLLEEWFAGGVDDESQLAKDMARQLVERYRRSNGIDYAPTEPSTDGVIEEE